MEPHYYAAFLETIGHTVRELHGVYWFNVFSHAWICFPLETQLNPAEIEPSGIVDHRGGLVRYCCSVEDGFRSFRHVASAKDYGFSSLLPKNRNQTRQGLEKCTCGPVDARELSTEGIALHAETMIRQGRRLPDNYEAYWRRYFEAVSSCPAATVWACRYQGMLASFLISFRIGNVENVCIIRSREELLKHRPNNAMLFTFLQHALSRPETSEVCIGLQSLQSDMSSLDLFKRGMGFEEKVIGQRVEFQAPLGFAVPRFVAQIAGKAAGKVNGEYAARLAGALTIYANQPRIRRSA
ncbi:MAG: GNAT family N-acetyltransferase [Planctomycetota bacterium]